MERMTPAHDTDSTSRGFVRAAVDDVARLARITRVMGRHGFAELGFRSGVTKERGSDARPGVDPRRDPNDAAVGFRQMLEELGPTFVKVGQILSTRPDLLPPPFIRELSRLQDRAPTIPFEEVHAAIEKGLGRSIDTLYASVDPTPLASASMAQTHLARLHDGTEVVIKVQRPHISEVMRADLDLLHLFARLMEWTIREMDVYAPGDVVAALDDALSQELDFRIEARNLERFAEGLGQDSAHLVPRLYPTHSDRTILTMSRVPGVRLDTLVPDSEEANRVATALIDAFYQQIFRFGFVHGDPHPGNLLWTPDGRVGWIDFGLCGSLSVSQRDKLVLLLLSTLTGDIDGLTRCLVQMGRPLGHVSLPDLRAEVAAIREKHLRRRLSEIDVGAFLEECMDAAQRYRIRVSPEYAILSKATATLDGVIRGLTPNLDVLAVLEPYGKRLIQEHYAADRLLRGAVSGVVQMGQLLSTMPDQLNQVLTEASAGRLRLQVDAAGLTQLGQELNRQTTRLFLALGAGALAIATPLWFANEPWRIWNDQIPVMTVLTGMGSATLAFWGVVAHIGGGRTRDFRVRLATLIRWARGRWFR